MGSEAGLWRLGVRQQAGCGRERREEELELKRTTTTSELVEAERTTERPSRSDVTNTPRNTHTPPHSHSHTKTQTPKTSEKPVFSSLFFCDLIL